MLPIGSHAANAHCPFITSARPFKELASMMLSSAAFKKQSLTDNQ
ncbi:hypothetical protein FB99_07700 [Pantoea agglomerans]|nr:hypothetical protein FB99_07700 [Pantoea agglomerans]